ncbi:MAG TPA: hypothetical protein PLO78_05190 [Candidatus Omnitrophota bacterium]|nr:hypothetical protein [Candidatus Omnitrophota bacterium]
MDQNEVNGKILERAALHYQDVLKESQKAQEFLRRNGLLNGEILQRYRVGFCDGSLPKEPDVRGELVSLGILDKKGKELLRNFIVIPITKENGTPLGLYAHYIYQGTHLYLPERGNSVFNATFATGRDTLYVVPNPFEALSLINAGLHETVAFCGESPPSADRSIFEESTLKRVYFFWDEGKIRELMDPVAAKDLEIFKVSLPEKAGSISRFLSGGGNIQTLIEKAAKIEIVKSEPAEAVKNRIPFKVIQEESAIYFIRGDLTYRIKGLNVRRVGSLKATIKVQNSESYHLDTFDLYSSRARAGFARQVKKVMKLEESRTNLDMKEIVEKLETIQLKMLGDEPPEEKEIMTEKERTEALGFLKSETLVQKIVDDAKACAYVGEEKNLLLGYLVSLSRKLRQPLALFIVSQSGAGKTELQDRVLSFTPPEDYLKVTRLTDQSLFYQGQQTLAHKLIAVEEEQGITGAGYSIRHLLSTNHLTSMTTIRDEATGKLKAVSHKVQGPVSMMITTTNPEINYETYNRFLVLSVDESQAQTRKILEVQRRMETLEGVLEQRKYEKIRRLHQNMQRLIEPLEVVNPYAEKLRFLDSLLRARREQKKYHSLIRTIALLRQYQKEIKMGKDGNESFKYIEVGKTDIRIANDLAREFLLKGLDELSPQGRRLIQIIGEMVKKNAQASRISGDDVIFTRKEIRKTSGWSHYQIHMQMRELVELEYLYPVAGGKRGQKCAYKLAWDGVTPWTEKDLCLVDAEGL